ncbi:MAG: hypothetical protein RUMPE_00246 [Eubacteriales bacterium SKADARSKE-1]|nr:hypothetical protein [Eubacteriales bacterium SKADARSKE-1]
MKIFKKIFVLIFLNMFCISNSTNASSPDSFKIVLDAGHGAADLGCAKNRASGEDEDTSIRAYPHPSNSSLFVREYRYNKKWVNERSTNLKIAFYLKEELQKYKTLEGNEVKVFLTRTTNEENPALFDRVNLGKQLAANVVISLHNNASGNYSRKARGAMVLVTSSKSDARSEFKTEDSKLYLEEESLANSILKELEKIGISRATTSGETLTKGGTLPITPGQISLENGLLRRFSEDTDKYPNGQLSDFYKIIRAGVNLGIPAIIVEHAYFDNEVDYKNFLSTDKSLKALAKADAKGIANFYRLQKQQKI